MAESNKKSLRIEARRHRALVHARREDSYEACEHFFASLKPEKGQVVASYWPVGSEFDSQPIVERLLAQGHVCALPVVKKDELGLGFAAWHTDMDLKKGEHGILEPVVNDRTKWVEPDIVIVPLLAFDRRGYRLGQGGGYYDATLAGLRAKKKIIAVGLAYAQQACLFNLPVEEHDQKLDWVVTPMGAHCFNF